MLIAVGGNSRKAGKTGVICALIRAIPEAGWTAVKVSPHAHKALGSGGDTGRFLAAGAKRALLLDSVPAAWPSGNVIVESGSVADADVRVFVVDATKEWKVSAGAALGRADVFVITGGEWDENAARAAQAGPAFGRPTPSSASSALCRQTPGATGGSRADAGVRPTHAARAVLQGSGRPVFHAGPPLYESAELAAYIRALLNA